MLGQARSSVDAHQTSPQIPPSPLFSAVSVWGYSAPVFSDASVGASFATKAYIAWTPHPRVTG